MKEFCMSVSCDKESLIKEAGKLKKNSFHFHRMAVTNVKIFLQKLKPSAMKDRDYYSSKQLF